MPAKRLPKALIAPTIGGAMVHFLIDVLVSQPWAHTPGYAHVIVEQNWLNDLVIICNEATKLDCLIEADDLAPDGWFDAEHLEAIVEDGHLQFLYNDVKDGYRQYSQPIEIGGFLKHIEEAATAGVPYLYYGESEDDLLDTVAEKGYVLSTDAAQQAIDLCRKAAS